MTAAELQARLAELKGKQKQAEADFYVLQGQILDCEHWIAVVAAAEADKKPVKK